MSGHSKWSTIKHRKAAQDAKRGKAFTKLIKELTIAARMGGSELDANPRLRTAVANAKSQSMPKDNIDRAIKKGAGELDGAVYEEIIYEGYGPHNVAIIVEVMTDNRNRTIASVRHAFSKCNGNLGSANSVQYMFDRIGSIMIEKTVIEEDLLTDLILEAGADDINTENPDAFQIITSPADFDTVRSYLEEKEVAMLSAEVIWNPQNRVEIDDSKKAEQVIKLIDILEDDEDVNSVHSNFDISDNVMAELG
ncbi:MAG: YebC/PmpR family DNA-binding transcriptional regulator [SAR324 cluster bacterium]|jgi:YebC/PmpR family DNA-binding regulatory protein|nr:YebC/PmpR family DNA-binding transcriptional regulator [SAR324 cluster bacterium]MEC8980327.1 YebC/PmpR family DNA-binding transcriptional regulator [SAR324 cluster bacterium]MEC9012925.1 YebC/PmpR family DNA-binding transcriptional regulator [SAR324 cluster bacterium]MEC9297123.1 YebC/PmpR family DNA-binding transcriptional regulator [SAR324 cluster bacterium]MED5403008.1 YebC/PmpR family DNA-binding transcriptional regulator [SAR324 cluster bacterium]